MPCSPRNDPLLSFHAEDRILVTGASSGIGAAIALRLNSLGATVIAGGRSAEKLTEVKASAPRPENFHPETYDLTADMQGMARWVKNLRAKYGILSGLAHSAGRTLTASFMLYDLDEARGLFDLLCHAPLLLTREILDRRNCRAAADGGTSVVYIAALAGTVPNKGLTVYSAAKAALICAARCMGKELAPRGIRINCISPGFVQTPMQEETAAVLGEEYLQAEEALYPLGLGQPEDVGNLAAFLLSPAARWITGQNYILDGGRLP
ncbi:MAG: SDR family oxidoreductase [Desulfovibrio sp.]|jgi:NAD(P)-dependent dehydrogenase (short-subunit alcohol dehydrogenase family)|nr:SDR family oxidoreductase [Desulfovibrio sp.]